MESPTIWLSVFVIASVTALLRFLPFLLFKSSESTPKFITELGRVLPYAIMGMLVVYCLKDTSFSHLSMYGPQLISCLVVVVLHVWKRNTLISIVSATICYMILVQVVF